MSLLPNLTIKNSWVLTSTLNRRGQLANIYSPLQNMTSDTLRIEGCTTEGENGLDFDLGHPVDILVQDANDGAVNLVLNDGKTKPKLVNSRFSVQEDQQFFITDRIGFKDTNIYNKNTFQAQGTVIPYVDGVMQIQYDGLINDGGALPCGIYIFYFKFADVDGNKTTVQGESGLVYCHKGQVNNPASIRFGLEDENTDKAVKFTLSNVDIGYTHVYVYYARVYGTHEGSDAIVHFVTTPYAVNVDGTCDIIVTGNESTETVSGMEIHTAYADLGSVETQTSFGNMLLQGNVESTYHDWEELQRISWRIFPRIKQCDKGDVGMLDTQYTDLVYPDDRKCIYYNTKNLYYRVGYWPEEIYRFGIVYIFEDGSLSPVLNILGVDFIKHDSIITVEDLFDFFPSTGNYVQRLSEPESLQFSASLNSRGVTRLPYKQVINYDDGKLVPQPLYIEFDLSNIGKEYPSMVSDYKEVLKKHKIKGYFMVRQIRTPNIICQGLVIQHSDKDRGGLPCLLQGDYILGQSFLDANRNISHDGYFTVANHHTPQAFIAPDAILQTPIFNDIFGSGEFNLKPVYKCVDNVYSNGDYSFKRVYGVNKGHTGAMKIINVPDGSVTRTNGVDYFSGVAGNAYNTLTEDLLYVWNKTLPQTLSQSTSLVRGLFGTYAGLQYDSLLEFGQLCNVYKGDWDDSDQCLNLIFQKLKTQQDEYYAICDRQTIDSRQVECFRGDCFVSLFTHRLLRNFTDPENPTNSEIIDIQNWKKNYAVRCTAFQTNSAAGAATSNCKKENEGWLLKEAEDNVDLSLPLFNQRVEKFILDVGKLDNSLDFKLKNKKIDDKKEWILSENNGEVDPDTKKNYKDYFIYVDGEWIPYEPETPEDNQKTTGNVNQKPIFPTEIPYAEGNNWWKYTYLKQPDPPKDTGFALVDFAVQLHNATQHQYVTRGLKNINRSDLNAVGLGQWITFPVCTSLNIAMRDVDFTEAVEETIFNSKRAFYPFREKNKFSKQADSYHINMALKNTVPAQQYFSLEKSNFFKQEYFNRIYYSLIDSASTETNEWKQIFSYNFMDYTKEYGTITKIIGNGNNVYVIFEHGIGTISYKVKEEGGLGLSTIQILDSTYGSQWKDSIIATDAGIFGVDTVAKAIWKLSGETVEIISTRTVNKFLIDNIDLSEFTKQPYIGHINVKTHYNANKHDVIFTYYNDTPYSVPDEFKSMGVVGINDAGIGVDKDNKEVYIEFIDEGTGKTTLQYCKPTKVECTYDDFTQGWKQIHAENVDFWQPGVQWSLCYNCESGVFTTFYDWIPLESANINNIFFSFDKDAIDELISQEYTSTEEDMSALSVDVFEINRNTVDPSFNNVSNSYYVHLSSPSEKIKIPVPSGYTNFRFYIRELDNRFDYIKVNNIQVHVGTNNWVFCSGQLRATDTELVITAGVFTDEYCTTPAIPTLQICDLVFCNLDEDLTDRLIVDIADTETGRFSLESYNYRDTAERMLLWKHGQAGIYDNQGPLLPTNWYGKQREFNFEFIARPDTGAQAIFNNLKILSNKAQPGKFEFEIVGEGYEWWPYKEVIHWANSQVTSTKTLSDVYLEILSTSTDVLRTKYPDFPKTMIEQRAGVSSYQYKKIPYLEIELTDRKGRKDRSYNSNDAWSSVSPTATKSFDYKFNTSETVIKNDVQLNEYRVHSEQLGNDMWQHGRVRGNMQYLEDYWNVEIRPINFRWAYLKSGQVVFKKIAETRHRDKYLKVKIRYSGKDLAVIQGIQAMYEHSLS